MADKKVTQLTALTAPANNDILLIVDDPSGTPVSKKITVEDLNIIHPNAYKNKSKLSRSLLKLSLDNLIILYDDDSWIITNKGLAYLYDFAATHKNTNQDDWGLMPNKYANKIVTLLKRIIKSIKSFQDLFKLFETLASILLIYITRKKISFNI